MNVIKRRALPLLLALVLLLPCIPAGAAAAGTALPDVRAVCGQGEVALQRESTGTYLFLPAAADLHALTLYFNGSLTLTAQGKTLSLTSGVPFDLAALFPQTPGDGVYPVTLGRGRTALTVKVMHSENIASLFLTSADVSKDRAWVEKAKSNKAKGSAYMQGAHGTLLYSGPLKQIKGRGNSTWDNPKKPYQIKLDQAADLLECGEPAKTWVLLANYYDRSLLRNRMIYDLATEMGLAYSPHTRPVDLYYDGEYLGSYLLSEKTEVGANRVDIHDLEADIEAANPDVKEFDALPLEKGTTQAGYPCQYVKTLREPEQVNGGYLLEIDLEERAYEEASWFSTPLNLFLVVKSPEYATPNAMAYISSFWQMFEDAVVNGGVHPRTGQPYTAYVDERSLVKNYLLLELTMDADGFRTSTYFYKPDNEEKLYAGPVWDFDLTLGLYFYADLSPERLIAGNSRLGYSLLQIPSYRLAVREEEQTLHHLIQDILLSDDPNVCGASLHTLSWYEAEVAASRRMDLVRWKYDQRTNPDQRTAEDLRRILSQREAWLYQQIESKTIPDERALFLDVLPSDWYAPAVEAVVEQGLFKGVSQELFLPSVAMTRCMAATVLYRMAGAPETGYQAVFTDVPEGTWYAKAVSWAYENQVVTGYPDGTFQPNAPVTRQELVALMHRYALSKGAGQAAGDLPATFADRDQVPDWARGDFAWAVEQSLVAGSAGSDGALVLAPQGQATRAQGAALFLRLSQFLETLPPAEEAPGPVEPAPAEQTPPAETTPAEPPAETGTQTAP